jgi:hypothetical protein
MCWSGEASAVWATLGISTTIYAAYKKEPPVLWLALGYFSLMEALQAYTYSVINQCSLPANQVATLLGYLHIAFQPFFANMVALYFVPDAVAKPLRIPVYIVCACAALMMMLQVYPFSWGGACVPGDMLCGRSLCSVFGNWHIAWEIPTNGFSFDFGSPIGAARYGHVAYVIAVFIMPLLYGSWKMVLYHALLGPILSIILTNNPNEQPAVWCLLSIGLLLIVVKTPIRRWLHVKRWGLWPSAWRGAV